MRGVKDTAPHSPAAFGGGGALGGLIEFPALPTTYSGESQAFEGGLTDIDAGDSSACGFPVPGRNYPDRPI